jgi:hypothetical protein
VIGDGTDTLSSHYRYSKHVHNIIYVHNNTMTCIHILFIALITLLVCIN